MFRLSIFVAESDYVIGKLITLTETNVFLKPSHVNNEIIIIIINNMKMILPFGLEPLKEA